VSSLIKVGPFPAIQSTVNVTKHLECVPACELHLYKAFSAQIICTFTCLTSHLFFLVYFAEALALALFLVFVHIAEPISASILSDIYTHAHNIYPQSEYF